jgi:hypothetical protein
MRRENLYGDPCRCPTCEHTFYGSQAGQLNNSGSKNTFTGFAAGNATEDDVSHETLRPDILRL